MKKLLLSAMAAALFVTNADGSLLPQTKSSKVNVDTQLKNGMGNYYKGMVSLVHSMLIGWADAFSYAAKDPDFSGNKTELNNASKKLKTIAEFTEYMLERKSVKGITKKRSSASTALAAFQQTINSLINTEYWKHCGAQLRFSVIATNNALKSLVYPSVEFDVGGIRYSANQGLIDANGASVENDLIANRFSSGGQPASQTSQVIELASGFNSLAAGMPKVIEPQIVTNTVSNVVAPQQTVTNTASNVAETQQTVTNTVSSNVATPQQTVTNTVSNNVTTPQQTVTNTVSSNVATPQQTVTNTAPASVVTQPQATSTVTTNNVLQNSPASASSIGVPSSTSSSTTSSKTSNKRRRR